MLRCNTFVIVTSILYFIMIELSSTVKYINCITKHSPNFNDKAILWPYIYEIHQLSPLQLYGRAIRYKAAPNKNQFNPLYIPWVANHLHKYR